MPYSVFVFVALAIHVLINIDMFVKKDNINAIKEYRFFAIVIAIFYLTDALWGVFEENKMALALYADTFVYFVMMGATIFFWTNFVVKYVEDGKIFSQIIRVVGILFFVAELVILIVNVFTPILFTVDENAVYTGYPARNIMLWAQIGMYSLVTTFSVFYTFMNKVKNYRRYIAVSLFSIVMIICIAIQLQDPYIPFYSIGCLIGVCILDTYALSDTKETFKEAYQETSKISEANEEKLGKALTLAYSDPLTGVKSKHAYVELEEKYDKLISEGTANEFAIIVFDLNGLKKINDTKGHEKGDEYIVESVKIIANYFPFETIYRFGGDEFVAVLEGDAFKHRQKNLHNFMKEIDENAHAGDKPIISSGISVYRKCTDNTFRAGFYRADKMMYSRKEFLKENHN